MKKNLICILAYLFSTSLFAQGVPVDPDPGCNASIQSEGVVHGNGYSTHRWVHVSGDLNGDDDCDDILVSVDGNGMIEGDFAYAKLNVDQFSQLTQDQEDFLVDLTYTFTSLPLNKEITVVELMGYGIKLGEVSLTKKPKFFSTIGGNAANYWWNVSVRWVDGSTVISQNNFRFEFDDVIPFNYIWDAADPDTPVSLLHLGGNKISIDPREGQIQGGGGLVAENENGFSTEVLTLHLGIIESDYLLIGGDRIFFDLNLINGIQSY